MLAEPSIASPALWAITVALIAVLFGADFLITRRPHTVSTREAALWSAVYIAIPIVFGIVVWSRFGTDHGTEFFAGYVVEKSLSIDNLFVFMLVLGSFAVPEQLRQRVLLLGIIGALALRSVFIALGAAALERFSITFLLFGVILLLTSVKIFRDAVSGDEKEIEPADLRAVRIIQRLFPVTPGYHGTRMTVRDSSGAGGRRALTPLAVVTITVLFTDVVFAVDSVPAVYGITGDAYLGFATNAFALLGLRALYFLLASALSRLVHLGYGLGAILVLIGAKLVLHWAHGIWHGIPQIPTLLSLGLIIGVLAVVTITSLLATRERPAAAADPEPVPK
jgi:tellurite resistance protein TerC